MTNKKLSATTNATCQADVRLLAQHNESMRETAVLSRQFTDIRDATHPTDITKMEAQR